MKYNTIKEATEAWVREFNAISTSMIEVLRNNDPYCEWSEVTIISVGDRVYESENGEYGEVINYDKENEVYKVELDNSMLVSATEDTLEVELENYLIPSWPSMWQFSDPCDNWWLEEKDGIRIMSNLGFRIFYHEEWGYFFGLDGGGYDFYEEHWIPLYKARGLHWHKDAEENEE